jgi:hypothetical protein
VNDAGVGHSEAVLSEGNKDAFVCARPHDAARLTRKNRSPIAEKHYVD